VLRPQLTADQEIVTRFFNEARALTQINDPGIVQVFDFGYDAQSNAYIVMELLDGEPMDKRIVRQGPFTLLSGLRLAKMLARSLATAHAKGVIHRDLKPENIFIVGDLAVTGGERAKILDFGIAKMSDASGTHARTQTGMLMGTPIYMSPEQCRGAGGVDSRTDIYSLGCVMMTMLTGRPPFWAEGVGDLIMMHMTTPAPLASTREPALPGVVDSLIDLCLAKNPNERFQTMAELAEAIDEAEAMCAIDVVPKVAQSSRLARRMTPVVGMPYNTAATTIASNTITGASGQTLPPTQARRGWLVAGIGLIAIGAAAAVVAIGMSHSGSTASPNTTGAAKTDRAIAMPVQPADATAMTATTHLDAGIDAPPDAGPIADAKAAPDAKPSSQRPHNDHSQPAKGTPHDTPTNTDPNHIDRGD